VHSIMGCFRWAFLIEILLYKKQFLTEFLCIEQPDVVWKQDQEQGTGRDRSVQNGRDYSQNGLGA
jgi:hypothetical protein